MRQKEFPSEAYDRWKTAPPDDREGPACPTCGGETENYEEGFNIPGEGWESGTAYDCNECKAKEAEEEEDEEAEND